MSYNEGRSSRRDRSEFIISILEKLLIPVAIFLAGFIYSYKQDAANDKRLAYDRLSDLIEPLSNKEPSERRLAVVMLGQFYDTKGLENTLVPALITLADDEDSLVRKLAAESLVAQAERDIDVCREVIEAARKSNYKWTLLFRIMKENPALVQRIKAVDSTWKLGVASSLTLLTDVHGHTLDTSHIVQTTVAEQAAMKHTAISKTSSDPTDIDRTIYQLKALLLGGYLDDAGNLTMILQDPDTKAMIRSCIPYPEQMRALNPQFATKFEELRTKVSQQIGYLRSKITWFTTPYAVQITGIGYFNTLPNSQDKISPNGRELHPILDIIFY